MTDLCHQFDALIARAAQLPPQEAAKLEAHLAGCSSCRELARVLRPVASDVAFAATSASDSASETVVESSSAATTARRDHDLPTLTTDRYRVTGEVGRGGIGRVMRARDQVLDRPVALKELFSASEGMRSRFIREALITARLQHPSIVPIYDAGRLGDRSPFYAMKLVAGRPLDKAITEASTLTQRLALLPNVLAIADAMAYAHSQRIIHRDLKPSNVLVGTFGETIVIDWGLAKDLAIDDRDALEAGPYRSETHDQTVAGVVLGTPAYMAPEQAAGEQVDERADVYALGAILYHVVSGVVPHEGTTFEELVHRVLEGEVRPLTERQPDVPRDLAAIVSKAMALVPAERYANAQGLADDLRRYLTGQLVASHSYGTRELVRRWLKRHRTAVTVALAALVVVAVVGVVSVVRIVRARQDADAAADVATQQRAIAEQQKTSATEMLTDLLTEQGRQELLAKRPARAAVYLSKAQAQSPTPGVAVRSLLADAMRSLDAQRLSLEGHTAALRAMFSRDGSRIVTASSDNTARIWDAATGAVVATLSGHVSPISAAEFSPDDSRVVTSSVDGTARLWDARTGKALATISSFVLSSASFSPDGTQILTTSALESPKLWDAASGRELAVFNGHREAVYDGAFSADGTRVITAGMDHTAKVWNAKTGKLVRSLDGHRDDVLSAVFSPDGSLVLTASRDNTAKVWDARTGKLLHSLAGHTAGVNAAVFSPDGSRIVTASVDHSAKVWDAASGNLLSSLEGHGSEVNSVAFSSDGSRVASASSDHTAKLWDARIGSELASFEGHRDVVWSVQFSPDGTKLLTGSADGTAKVWDAAPGKLRATLVSESGLFSPDGASLLTIADDRSVAQLRDASTGKVLASLQGHGGEIESETFDGAGKRVLTTSMDRTAKIWDAKTGKLLASIDHTDEVDAAAISPDGARVVTASDNTAQIWNANNGALLAKLEGHDIAVTSVEFSEDGARVITAAADGTARIWRADTGAPIVTLAASDIIVRSAAFSRDGERVVTAASRTARLWDARTGKLLASLEHTNELHAVSFSGDRTRVVTACGDHTAKLWDARTGKLLASLEGHTDEVLDAAFSPDAEGARVVTASADHTARLWDGRTGKLLGVLAGHTDAVVEAAFSPDGTRVMTTSDDGKLEIWDVHLEARPHDAIQRIIDMRAPWRLSSSRLMPVPPAFTPAP